MSLSTVTPNLQVPALAVATVALAVLVVGLFALLGAAPASAAVSTSYPNVVFSDGFDSGSLSNWSGSSGTGKVSVTGAAANSGAAGVRLSNASGQYSLVVKQLSAPLTDSSTSFWVRVDSAGSGYSGTNLEDIAEARDNASSADVWQLIYDSKQQGLWFFPFQGQTEQAVFTGAGSVPLGSWNHIEVRYTATSSGGAEIVVNGQTQPGWALSGNYARSDNLQRIQLWNDAVASTDFDSVVVATPGSAGGHKTTPPSNTGLPVVSGTAQQGQALSTSNGSWSNSPTSYAYAWQDCNSSGASCVAISGATSSSYTLGSADVGHTIRSVVKATNGGGSASSTSAQTAVVSAATMAAPSNTVPPAVSGTAQQGSKLTTTKGSWTGSPTSYGYKWQDCNSSGASCAAISGATASSYTPGSADVGHTIRAVVMATNPGGSTPATSGATADVTASAPPAPQNTGLPVVSGTAQQGQTLTTTNGTWSGSPTSFAYKWEDCNSSGASCAAISGATSSSYTLASTDVGDTVRAVVTATNAGGSTAATSAQTALVSASGGSGGGGGGASGQSVVFWLGWDSSMTESQVPWNAVTQVDLFALQTTAGSSLDTSLLDAVPSVPNWVSAVHAQHRLAIITIGGISDQHWDTACGSTYRSAFVANLVNYMKTNGFDGIDIDIEQNNWASQSPPVAAWDTCVQAISQAAHATTTAAGATPIVSTDIDQTWMDPDVAGFSTYPDQFNLMGYSNSCSNSCMAGQVQDLLSTGKVPSASELTMGMDTDQGDSGQTVTAAQCGSIASWASGAGLGGVMVWTMQGDGASHPCMNQIAPYTAPAG